MEDEKEPPLREALYMFMRLGTFIVAALNHPESKPEDLVSEAWKYEEHLSVFLNDYE